MIYDYPKSLPGIMLLDGYAEIAADGRLRSKMDRGVKKTRRLSSAVPRLVRGSFALTPTQKKVHREFWDKSQASFFWMPDQDVTNRIITAYDGGPPLVQPDTIDETVRAIDWWLCTWGDTPPSYEPMEKYWRATVEVEVHPR